MHMPGGYSGKILRVNLTKKTISKIDTAQYEEFGGGHGIGSAIFFDLVGDQLPFDGFDPRNLIMMIASPFSGTFVPGSGRCEVQGLGPMLYPVEWFGHSNFGGRFTAQLKFAGWDGVVVEGASDDPVWINIVDDKVTIESAKGIWGMDTWDTQQEISRRVMPNLRYGEWAELAKNYFTTQIPAVVCCGPAGETKSRLGCLVHGPGSQAALCGFGGVFGSKKLKAISAIGSGGVPIADPKAMMETRLWFRQFLWDVDNPYEADKYEGRGYTLISGQPSGGNVLNGQVPLVPARAAACASCPRGCRMRLATGESNEAVCAGTMAVNVRPPTASGGPPAPGAGGFSFGDPKLSREANDLMTKMGLGHWQFMPLQSYIVSLYRRGLLGKDKKIPCDLAVDQAGSMGYADTLMRKIAARVGIGDDLAEGCARFAQKYGLLKDDLSSGVLSLTYWGTSEHYDSRVEVEWGYGSLLGERDLMQHMMANYPIHWMAQTGSPYLTAEEVAHLYTDAMVPYNGDPYMVDYSPTGVYSDSKVKQVAWVKHYEKFWTGAGGFCGWRWPMCITNNTPDHRGPTPNAEPRFWNAVTGKKLTFADGMEIGHKIYTLDRSIWILQGRHRNMEVFPDYVYDQKSRGNILPMYQDGKWSYETGAGRTLDRAKVEDFKTKFYKFEGYNSDNGYPTRDTLEKMGLKKVADLLQSRNRLG
jgi:aldehyde:ferredoxin oxidoreductase